MLISTWNQNLRELSSLVVGSVNCVAPSTPSLSLECESLGVEMNIWREKTFDKSFMDESCLLGRWRILRKKMESFLCAQWMWKGASLKALERSKLDDSTHSSHIFCRKKEETSCNDIFVIEKSNELKHAAHAGCIEPRYERQKAFYNPKTMNKTLNYDKFPCSLKLNYDEKSSSNGMTSKKHTDPRHTKKGLTKQKKMYVESCKTPTTAKLAPENYVQQANIMMKSLCVQNSLSPQNFTFLQLHTALSLTASFDRAASSCSR